MRNRLLALAGFLVLTGLAVPAAAQLQGWDTAPGSSCAGFAAGATRMTADADQNGAEITLICDGSTWNPAGGDASDAAGNDGEIQFNSGGALAARADLVFSSAGDIGIGQATPKATLHVGGEAIVGNTGLACDADREGALRWNSTYKTIEMCNGVDDWQMIVATTSPSDTTPDAFSFTDVTSQSLNSLIVSDIINITGIDSGVVASVSGSGSPEISVNGGAWGTSATINSGDSLQVKMISSNAVSTARIATVTVGTASDDWSVTTKAGQTRIFMTINKYRGDSLGGLAGADAICQAEAGNIGYGGIWKVILSDDTTYARDRLTIAYPVVRASDGTVVDSLNMWDGSIEKQIYNSASTFIWTGSNTAGITASGKTCDNWTGSGIGNRGYSVYYADNRWIELGTTTCTDLNALYCVDQ